MHIRAKCARRLGEPLPQDRGNSSGALPGDRPEPGRRTSFDRGDLRGSNDGSNGQSSAFLIFDLDVFRPARVGRGGDHQNPQKIERSAETGGHHERGTPLLNGPFDVGEGDGDHVPAFKARHNPRYRPRTPIRRSRRRGLRGQGSLDGRQDHAAVLDTVADLITWADAQCLTHLLGHDGLALYAQSGRHEPALDCSSSRMVGISYPTATMSRPRRRLSLPASSAAPR